MQLKRTIDWQIRKLLRKHPVPSHQMKEELWRGIAAALDEQQPVRRTNRGLIAWVAALFLAATGTAAYFLTAHQEPIANTNTPAEVYASAPGIALQADKTPKAVTPDAGSKKQLLNRNAENKTGIQTWVIAKSPVEEESSNLAFFFDKEIAQQSLVDTRNALAALSIRQQELGLSSNNPLLAKDLKYQKRNRNHTAESNGSGWSSLFVNIWDNPAFTGASGKLALTYDDQMSFFDYWANGIYRDHFAADGRIPKTPFSIGAYHDRAINAYSMKTATAFTASAQVLKIGSGYLSAGAGISYLSKRFFITENTHYANANDFTFGLKEVTKKRSFTTLNTAVSLDAGTWYQGKHLVAGASVKNANQPLFGYSEQGERLARSWHFTGGYRMNLGKFQVLPMVEIERNKLYSQASASVLATFDDKLSIGGAIQNISPVTLRGDKVAYAGAKVFKNTTIFTSYGRNGEMAAKGINRHIIHTGIRFQLP